MKPSTKKLAAAAALLIVITAAYFILKPKQQAAPPAVAAVAAPTTTDTVVVEKVIQQQETKPAATPKAQVKTTPNKQAAPEKFNPNKYLVKSIKTRKNIVGKTVIEGTITNSSSNMVFKDVVIDVTYLSKTDANISTQHFVVYEVIQPGKKVPFKFKAKAPDGTKSFNTELVDAVVVK